MDAETRAALEAMLPFVPRYGWTERALAAGLVAAGRDAGEVVFHFPRGAPEMVEAYFALALERARAAAGPQVACENRVSKRVRALVAALLRSLAVDREAARRACGWLLRPGQAVLAARITARIVDAIWEGAGDTAEDLSWYTKRASLAAILLPTFLFWLARPEESEEAALAFFERRLAGLGRIGRLRARLSRGCGPRRPLARPPAAAASAPAAG
ncbi:hypothetical protein AcidC75_12320 [Acidisoma sp. C75]